MENQPDKETGLEKAIRLAEGPAKLAALLSQGKPDAERVSPQVVSNWRSRGVPIARCPEVERALEGRVTCAELRPDFFAALHDITPSDRGPHAAQ